MPKIGGFSWRLMSTRPCWILGTATTSSSPLLDSLCSLSFTDFSNDVKLSFSLTYKRHRTLAFCIFTYAVDVASSLLRSSYGQSVDLIGLTPSNTNTASSLQTDGDRLKNSTDPSSNWLYASCTGSVAAEVRFHQFTVSQLVSSHPDS